MDEKRIFFSNLSPALINEPNELLHFMSEALRHNLPRSLRGKHIEEADYTVLYYTKPRTTAAGKVTCVLQFSQPSIVSWIMNLPEKDRPVPPLELCSDSDNRLFMCFYNSREPGTFWISTPSLYQDIALLSPKKVCWLDVEGKRCPNGGACDYEHCPDGGIEPSLRYHLHRIIYELSQKHVGPNDQGPLSLAQVCMFRMVGGVCYNPSCKFDHDSDVANQLREDFVRTTLGRQLYGSFNWIKQTSQELLANSSSSSPRIQPSAMDQAVDIAFERIGLALPPPAAPAPVAAVRGGGAGSGSSVRRDPSPPAVAVPIRESAAASSSPRASKKPAAPPPIPASASAAATSSRDNSPSPISHSGLCISADLRAIAIRVEESEAKHRNEMEQMRAKIAELERKLEAQSGFEAAVSQKGLDRIEFEALHNLGEKLENAASAVRKEIRERTLCRICFENKIKVTFQCGHGVCLEDAEKFKQGTSTCPFCNKTVLSKTRVFF